MSEKNENNSGESNSINSSTEESGDLKGRTTAHQKITLPIFQKKNHSRSKIMVATIYPVRQNDSDNRFDYNDNRQRNNRRIPRRTGC